VQLASRRAYHGFLRHRGLDSAASLAFFAALSVFPASLAVVSAFALLDSRGHAVGDILRIADSVAPESTVATLKVPLEQLLSIPDPGIGLVIGLVLTLWTVSGYVTAFGRAINTAYGVQEGREWLLLRARMMLVALAIMVAGAIGVLLLAGTPNIALVVARSQGLPDWLPILWDILKWPVILGLAFVVVGLLYYYSPNVRHLRIRWVTFGALLAVVVWVLSTAGFAVYVLGFSHYSSVYGWLGGAIVLLLWLYLTSFVVVAGAEADAELVRVRQLEAGIPSETDIQLPLRDTHRTKKLERWLLKDQADGAKLRKNADRRDARRHRSPGTD
jgi:membrane protein